MTLVPSLLQAIVLMDGEALVHRVLERHNVSIAGGQERLKGRIVLVGRMLEASITPQSQADSFYTPFFAATGQHCFYHAVFDGFISIAYALAAR